MFDINGDSQAFPNEQGAGGLTKREYFAAMALQGYVASPDTTTASFEDMASNAVSCADALLAELAK